MGILDLVKSKSSCFNLWEHEKYIYINQIYKLYNGNNTCADQQPYHTTNKEGVNLIISRLRKSLVFLALL